MWQGSKSKDRSWQVTHLVRSWEAPSLFSADEKGEATLLEEHCVDFQNLDQKSESSVLPKCMLNGPCSLFRLCLHIWFQGMITLLSPWLVSHRLCVLASQEQAGEAALMVQQLPLGWESQGYKNLTGKGRSLLGGKPEPWAVLLQQKMSCSSPHYIPVSGIKDI